MALKENMNAEIERLRKEKKRIDQKIKEIINGGYNDENIVITNILNGSPQDEWFLKIRVKREVCRTDRYTGKCVVKLENHDTQIYKVKTQKEAVKKLQNLIEALQKSYEKAKITIEENDL